MSAVLWLGAAVSNEMFLTGNPEVTNSMRRIQVRTFFMGKFDRSQDMAGNMENGGQLSQFQSTWTLELFPFRESIVALEKQ